MGQGAGCEKAFSTEREAASGASPLAEAPSGPRAELVAERGEDIVLGRPGVPLPVPLRPLPLLLRLGGLERHGLALGLGVGVGVGLGLVLGLVLGLGLGLRLGPWSGLGSG